MLLAACLAGAGLALPASSGAQVPNDALDTRILPPWQNGLNNDALKRGVPFTVAEVDVLADFHGSLDDPRLVLYVGGNYFFAMAPLVREFEHENPAYLGHVFWETLPPGILEKQMAEGGTITSGNMTFTVRPDVYLAGLEKVESMVADGRLAAPAVSYVSNQLTIMVPKGNPAQVRDLRDLGGANVRLVMPNPTYEGVAAQIKEALRKAGGEALAEAVYQTKVGDGTTLLTQIHHRQTPLFLMKGRAVAGVTWQSEAIFQESIGNPIAHVDLAPEVNVTAVYGAAAVSHASHPEAAAQWLRFIRSDAAIEIFKHYGFQPALSP